MISRSSSVKATPDFAGIPAPLPILTWCDGKRDLAEVIRLVEFEQGPMDFDFVGYFKFLANTDTSTSRRGRNRTWTGTSSTAEKPLPHATGPRNDFIAGACYFCCTALIHLAGFGPASHGARVRRFAEQMNMAAMRPEEKLSATRCCLAARGTEYLVFQHDRGEFTLDLNGAPGAFAVEWSDNNAGRAIPAETVRGATRAFTTPFPVPAALHLKRTGN